MDTLLKLTLLQLPKIGRQTARAIIGFSKPEIKSTEDLWETLLEAHQANRRIPLPEKNVLEKAHGQAREIMEMAEKKHVKIISETDDAYPQRYHTIQDKPLVLFVKGNLKALNSEHALAVIGTRGPSNFGIKAGDKLTKYFVEAGCTIVSGLAIGCDTVAHNACLKNKGITVAVLAGGVDQIYPKQNGYLVEKILDHDGTILSEYAMGTLPRHNYFVERDRLQSGLSDAICIVETAVKGGTMHTFRFATEQGRLTSVLQHPVDKLNEKSMGNQYLIEQKKAIPLGNKEDILRFIEKVKSHRVKSMVQGENKQIKLGF
ncbi:DNA-processing protein DprA [Rapidithrix thailandica]|uniref:DNA-processing protein DprA n=1 Tax=Rapidithrix thailandica TaxID=413964 RepID=A0AAW9S3I6_9BACT